jgi:hypothetical protein
VILGFLGDGFSYEALCLARPFAEFVSKIDFPVAA